ncbi:MAG: DNA polymerase I [Actinobacteria bacterium]|jgi:DNA polymerase-1|nr:DNA polymerase I [Actinomycetota bacterium]MBT3686911.1 DNA polymerase I [Actinomycetota bacterium]MBT4038090.1 DNA polymerase I [Actinomycetota bacterium]MBT4278257.1 DNA polymerase I [Actinomycetota bacterium]MBT4344375.1 DNA polymerase I [Actinomycetota bacterium]
MPGLMLLDGNSLTYRAFFALPPDLITASGQMTNAVVGFTSMLATLLRDHEPEGVAVAFDRPGPTFRHERLPSYKANREKQDDTLYEQLALVRDLVEALGMVAVDAEGFEADDVLATLATVARDGGRDVTIVTGDRDSFQLVEDPHVRVLYNKRGVSDYALYDEQGIVDRTGVLPNVYVAYAALRGDKSDNLPGVPGVGEKTAARLINEHGGLDGVFGAADDQTPKLSQNLHDNEHLARQNEELMELVRNVPLDLTVDDLMLGPVDIERASEMFDRLELQTARTRLAPLLGVDFGGDSGSPGEPDGEVLSAEVDQPSDSDSAIEAIDSLVAGGQPVAVAAVSDPAEGIGGGVALCAAGTGSALWVPMELLESPDVRSALEALLGVTGPGVLAHDSKALVRSLRAIGVDTANLVLDTALAAYLLDPTDNSYELDLLVEKHLRMLLPDTGAPSGQLDLDGDTRDPASEAAHRAAAIGCLSVPMFEALDEQGMRQLNDDVEVPLVRVLAKMEEAGVGVDVKELTRLRDDLTTECDRLRNEIQEVAGEAFNVNSTKQLRVILFEKLGLAPGRKTKTGYSTNAATLEKLRGEHVIVELLLSYREVEKLRSTYGEGLLAEVGEGERIRATFNQTVTRTGRLSSDAPNLHNIPVRSEMGRAFRRAFVPAAGTTLLVADYNQIELRCIAHLANDPGLIAAFEAGDDVHTAVASSTWGVPPDEVTTELRNRAKMVAYGLAYGMEAYGLAQRLGVPNDEAAGILDSYFSAFPAVRSYMDATVDEARRKGYTETLFGRRRRIPELASPIFNVRQAGERQAMNAGIQGLAADIFKVALVRIDRLLEERCLASRLILQVHDEVILEVPEDELDEVTELVTQTMAGAFDLRVDLDVNLATGDTWADAKA